MSRDKRKAVKTSKTGHPTYSYGDWTIAFRPNSGSPLGKDWSLVHDEYDGAPDAHDLRSGWSIGVEAAIIEIHQIEMLLDDE